MMDANTSSVLVEGFKLLAAIFTLIGVYWNVHKTNKIEKATDGMKDELVKVTRSDALHEGKEDGIRQGVKQEKKEQKERDA